MALSVGDFKNLTGALEKNNGLWRQSLDGFGALKPAMNTNLATSTQEKLLYMYELYFGFLLLKHGLKLPRQRSVWWNGNSSMVQC